ncbi:MAG: hypothetical protein H6599_10205 [Flavobacteriales bacterium]|nr:hypothetical protein [Flavobacteriales bacterium]
MLLRIITSFGLSLLVLFIQAKLPEFVPRFKIVSDTIDSNIPPGQCLVTGVVTFEDKTVNEAVIKAYNYNHSSGESDLTVLVNSNKLGQFRMKVDTSTFYLTAWKPGTGTVYVEGVKFKDQHHLVVEIYLPDDEMMDVVEKPVVYLYNDNDTKNVTVQVETKNEMLFSYPQMNEKNEWNVRVNADGIRTDDGRNYPYLFWEASSKGFDFYARQEGKILGQIIQTDSVINYLENKLYDLHLNNREVTDFITYWGPRIQQKNFALIQFKVDDEVNEIANLNISPQPDWTRRVYMVFTGFEEEPIIEVMNAPIIEEGLVKRAGFHAVEWGGTEIENIKL